MFGLGFSTAADDLEAIGNSTDTFHLLNCHLGQQLLVVRGDAAPQHDNSSLDFDLNLAMCGITGVAKSPHDGLHQRTLKVGVCIQTFSLRNAEFVISHHMGSQAIAVHGAFQFGIERVFHLVFAPAD